MKYEHDDYFLHPIQAVGFKLFGLQAEFRIFRSDDDRNSYYCTVAFKNMKDDDNHGFILEEMLNDGERFVIEQVPKIVYAENLLITRITSDEYDEFKEMILVQVSVKDTPIFGTAAFMRYNLPRV
jgi:hypothetical protein